MHIEPYEPHELKFAWCNRVYFRWRTHRRRSIPSLAQLNQETLEGLLTPYEIHLLQLTTNADCLRALTGLQPTESVAVAASKFKGRVSKWLGMQRAGAKPLGRGYFAVTTGQSTAAAVQAYLDRQGQHHGYADRPFPPVYVRRFERTAETDRMLQAEHAVTILRYHIVMATWQRRGVFGQPAAEMVTKDWQTLTREHRFFIDKVSFVPDHVHLAVAVHPSVSPASVVVLLMNLSQERMWERFDSDVIRAGVRRLWQPSAYIGSFGDLSSNAVSAYLRRWEQQDAK